jgi:hypothetical protein
VCGSSVVLVYLGAKTEVAILVRAHRCEVEVTREVNILKLAVAAWATINTRPKLEGGFVNRVAPFESAYKDALVARENGEVSRICLCPCLNDHRGLDDIGKPVVVEEKIDGGGGLVALVKRMVVDWYKGK